MLPVAQVAHRLRGKQQVEAQGALEGVELEEEAGSAAHRQVYLVTLPHPVRGTSIDGVRLAPPGASPKQIMLAHVLTCLREPQYVDGRNRVNGGPGVEVLKCGVWREYHKQAADGSPPRAHDQGG